MNKEPNGEWVFEEPSPPLDVTETWLRINKACLDLERVEWPEFSSVFESSAKANVGTALRHLDGARAALQEEAKRRAALPPGGDDRPAPGTATEFPRRKGTPTHPSSRRKPAGVSIIWAAVVATFLLVTVAVLLVLTEAGVIGW